MNNSRATAEQLTICSLVQNSGLIVLIRAKPTASLLPN
jgi:hypothetical protein